MPTDIETMKKFNQLFLTITAALSLILFLFYKHEYNRLYNVLEVMETFGDSKSKPCALQTNFKETKQEHRSIWQKIGPIYTYSAFLLNHDYKLTKIRILSLVNDTTPKVQKCSVWVDHAQEPSFGKLSLTLLSKTDSQSRYQAAIMDCAVTKLGSVPYAVTPFANSEYNKHNITVDVIPLPKTYSFLTRDKTAVCVMPIQVPYNQPLDIAEFLVFHQSIGLSPFYFYEMSLPFSVRRFLASEKVRNDYEFDVLPWKIPEELIAFTEQTNAILINDCIFRSKPKASYVFVTEINKYLIPHHHFTVLDVLRDIFATYKFSETFFFFNKQLFCMEYPHDQKFSSSRLPIRLLQKTRWRKPNIKTQDNTFLINISAIDQFSSSLPEESRHYTLPEDVMSIHWYGSCVRAPINKTNLIIQYDNVAFRFEKTLMESDALQFAFSVSELS